MSPEEIFDRFYHAPMPATPIPMEVQTRKAFMDIVAPHLALPIAFSDRMPPGDVDIIVFKLKEGQSPLAVVLRANPKVHNEFDETGWNYWMRVPEFGPSQLEKEFEEHWEKNTPADQPTTFKAAYRAGWLSARLKDNA